MEQIGTIGKRLEELRNELKMTNIELGTALNTHNSTIGKIIKGKNNLQNDQLFALYANYDVNMNWLISGKGKMFNKKESGPSTVPDHLLTQLKKDLEALRASLQQLDERLPVLPDPGTTPQDAEGFRPGVDNTKNVGKPSGT